jgi:site-specific DNA recombinase
VIRLTEIQAESESNGEARDDISSLIGEVVITPGEKRGESHATLRGELMAILDLAAGRRRSPKPEVITKELAGPRNQDRHRNVSAFFSLPRTYGVTQFAAKRRVRFVDGGPAATPFA